MCAVFSIMPPPQPPHECSKGELIMIVTMYNKVYPYPRRSMHCIRALIGYPIKRQIIGAIDTYISKLIVLVIVSRGLRTGRPEYHFDIFSDTYISNT